MNIDVTVQTAIVTAAGAALAALITVVGIIINGKLNTIHTQVNSNLSDVNKRLDAALKTISDMNTMLTVRQQPAMPSALPAIPVEVINTAAKPVPVVSPKET